MQTYFKIKNKVKKYANKLLYKLIFSLNKNRYGFQENYLTKLYNLK